MATQALPSLAMALSPRLPLTLLQVPGPELTPLPSPFPASADMGAFAWNTLSHHFPLVS